MEDQHYSSQTVFKTLWFVVPQVQEFLEFVNEQAANYRTNHIPVTMGGDFHYQDANSWFKNLDKLIK